MEFVFLFVVLLTAASIHLLIRIKIEQSIFLTVCLYFILMFFSGLYSSFTTGLYIIVAFAILSLAFIILKAVKKQISITQIITPGTVIFVSAFIVYYFSTQGALLHLWDEATHWGTTAKKMFYSDKLWTSGLQTLAAPVFNQVLLKFTGFKESTLYLSQWTLYLAAAILPLSGICWKKSYLAAFFSLGAIFCVSAIFDDGILTLYADGLLAFFFAALTISWITEKQQLSKKFVWAGMGVFMLVQIKSGSGTSLAVMFIAFILIYEAIIDAKTENKKKIFISSLIKTVVFSSIIIASQSLAVSFDNSYTGKSGGTSISEQMISSPVFITFGIITVVTIILFVIYSVKIFNPKKTETENKSINKLLIIFLCLTFVSGLSVLFYGTVLRPDFDVRTTVINFFKAFEKTKILNISIMYLIAIIIALYIINIFAEKKENKKELIVFYSSSLFFSGLYIIGVLYAYLSSFSLYEAVNTASFDRYIGTALMSASIFVFIPLLRNQSLKFKQTIISILPAVFCVFALTFFYNPSYKVAKETKAEAFEFRQTEISAAEYVKSKVAKDEKVFLVIQKDKGFVFNWMRYEFMPIITNGGYWSFGEGGGWSFAWNEEKLTKFLHDAHYDYLYLFVTDDYFNQRFADLFGSNTPESKMLYKFEYDSEPIFIPVK